MFYTDPLTDIAELQSPYRPSPY